MSKMGGNSSTAGSQWMSESDCATIHVQTVIVESKFLFNCQNLWGECFIDLENNI
jgi:hypothetical protein